MLSKGRIKSWAKRSLEVNFEEIRVETSRRGEGMVFDEGGDTFRFQPGHSNQGRKLVEGVCRGEYQRRREEPPRGALDPHWDRGVDDRRAKVRVEGIKGESSQGSARLEGERVEEKIKCYKCGKEGHHQAKCSNPLLCYTCKNSGHISVNCPQILGRKGLQLCGMCSWDKAFTVITSMLRV